MARTPTKVECYSEGIVTPVSKKVRLKQVFEEENRTLYRSISCDEVWTPISKDKGLTTTHLAVSKYIIPKVRPLVMTKKKTSTPKQIKTKSTGSFLKMGNVLYWLMTIFIAISVFHYWANDKEWNWEVLNNKLSSTLFGQDLAISNLEKAVFSVVTSDRTSLFVFTGGVGVGKSLAATTLIEGLPWPGKRHTISLLGLEDRDLHSFISIYFWNYLLIDDCNANILETDVDLINTALNYYKFNNYKVLVILLCTTHNETEDQSLRLKLSPLQPYHDIVFAPLRREHIELCFVRVLRKHEIVISDIELNRLIDEQMLPIKEVGSAPGCKQIEMRLSEFMRK